MRKRISSLRPWVRENLLFSRAEAEMDIPDELQGYSDTHDSSHSVQGGAVSSVSTPSSIRRDVLEALSARVRESKRSFLFGLFLMGVATALAVSEPWVFGLAIDRVLRAQYPLPPDSHAGELLPWAAFYLGVILLRVSAVSAQALVFERLGQRLMLKLRVQLFDHLLRLPVSVYDRMAIGKLVTRVSQDIQSMSEMFSAGVVSVGLNLLTLLGIVVWLFVLDLKLAIIATTLLLLLLVMTIRFTQTLSDAYRNARSKLSSLNAFLAENILGMRVLQLFGRERVQLDRYARLNHLYTFAQMGSVRLFAIFQPSITFMQGVAMALVLWIGLQEVMAGELALGVLVSAFAYVTALFQPMRELAEKWNIFLSGMASAERVFSLLSWKTEIQQDSVGTKQLPVTQGEIRFEGVWFAYQEERWVLQDFNLVIPGGTSLGVVGHTGAGKSTLMQLLLRFYEPQRGRILLDGHDLRDFSLQELRSHFGMIQQDVYLFSGTVLDNLRLSQVRRSEQEMRSLLSELGFDEVALSQPVEERGVNLSAGQKQMVSFARAWSLDPLVWILDEATSNIDSEGEEVLERVFSRTAKARTQLIVAHRLSTVRKADQILMMHQGKAIELGTHSQLMRNNGLYARWVRYQSLTEELGKDQPLC